MVRSPFTHEPSNISMFRIVSSRQFTRLFTNPFESISLQKKAAGIKSISIIIPILGPPSRSAFNCSFVFDGNHIPPHGPKGAGSKDSKANPEWQVVNRAKRKWASVWRPMHNGATQERNCVTEIIFLRMALKEQVARVVGRVPSGRS